MGVSPLITTIIPTYRRPRLLERAIRSVLRQTYPDFEVHVYDNASGDETSTVVARLASEDPRIKYHCHPSNIGAQANFQYGMTSVKTSFFSILSDDDILLPEFFQTALDGFESFPDAMFSAGSVVTVTERGDVACVPLLSWPRDGYFTPPEGLFEMIRGRHPTWTAIVFRTEVNGQVGKLDQEVGPASDLDFELRIAARFPFVVSKKPCAVYVNHSLSFSARPDFHFIWPGWYKLTRNLAEDQRIPWHVRRRAEELLSISIKRALFVVGLKCIVFENYEGAYKSANVLRERYKSTVKASILWATAGICERIPISRRLLAWLNNVRLSLSGRWTRNRMKNGSDMVDFSDCL